MHVPRFHSSDSIRARQFWPFALLSIPATFLGGYINLPTHVFKTAVALVLWFSAGRFLLRPGADEPPKV